jgi:hypothetical protein
MDANTWFAVAELAVGVVMAAAGAWQFVNAGPLPGVLGRSIRRGPMLEDLPPRRWQLSGAAQGLFGLGFLLFGGAVLLHGRVDEGGLGVIRTGGLLAWIVAIGLVVVVFRRYRPGA